MRSFPVSDTVFGDICDDNVCACVVSALILFLVVNLSLKMDSATSISYRPTTGKLSRPTLLFAYFGDFSLHMRSFDRISTSGLQYDIIFESSSPVFI